MPLTLAGTARVDGYNARSSSQYWVPGQVKYPTYQTFSNEVNARRVQRASRPPTQSVKEEPDRNLLSSVVVDDGLDEISYPIAPTDNCDCVTFPSEGFTLNPCGADVYWGTFEVKFTDGTCYDVSFDESAVYANCPSAESIETETEYVWCQVDFTEGTDDPDDLVTSSGGSDELAIADDTDGAERAKKETRSEETKTTSLRREITTEVKNDKHTHVHLTVHRVLTLALETLLALQSPSA